jgi:hypothetical protein
MQNEALGRSHRIRRSGSYRPNAGSAVTCGAQVRADASDVKPLKFPVMLPNGAPRGVDRELLHEQQAPWVARSLCGRELLRVAASLKQGMACDDVHIPLKRPV